MSESEQQTRRTRIDTRLRALGWTVVPFQPGTDLAHLRQHAITELDTASGPVDYAFVVDGGLVGVIEAKKLSLGPQNVLVQAERYARGLEGTAFDYDGLRVPFLWSTNGEVVWFHDVRHPLNASRSVSDLPTPNAVREALVRRLDELSARLLGIPNEHPRLRPYQREANAAIEAAIASNSRRMLVAMATGTGKTFTMVNQVYRFMKADVGRRVLFLVDRRALAAQAVRAFAAFEPEPGLKFTSIYETFSQRFRREDWGEDEPFDPTVLPREYLLDPQPKHAFVYISTIQRMAMNLFGRDAAIHAGDEGFDEDADERLDIPIHAFDIVIADECHRGYTAAELSVWRDTLEHFDAINIGLTATPAAHTTAYFKNVVYRYEYERAVREGFLVDFDAVKVKSGVRIDGVFLQEGEHVGLIDPTKGTQQLDILEDERQFDAAQVERDITVPDSNRKIIEEIKRYALEHEHRYGRFPKTLIFAANDIPHVSHADQLVTTCRTVFGRGDSFVQKITGSPTVDRPLQRIREFRNRPAPSIVVSVDMLTTGVDIPDLEFIVFLRPVKSRILFEQMLGRGTRKGEKYPDKSHFVVFDCFDGTLLEYFRNASAFETDPPDRAAKTIQELVEDIWQNRDREYATRCLVKRLHRINKEMSGDARQLFAAYIPDGDVAKFATGLPRAIATKFTETMKLLRDPAFQDLLINYPRPERRFLIAYEAIDEVSSQWLIRDGAGQEHKPADYLAAFAQFVRENPAHILAIEILLGRPKEWNTTALAELRQKLAASRERFTVDALQRAHALHYHKALVEVISMVKHAAHEEEPLLTAPERVDRALRRLAPRDGVAPTWADQFTEDQRRWLTRIRAHLIENLSIEREDFDDVPIFSREGGWNVANRSFDGKLEPLLRTLNEAIAA